MISVRKFRLDADETQRDDPHTSTPKPASVAAVIEPDDVAPPVPARPATAPTTVGQAFGQMTLDTAALVGGAVLIAIGSVGPWATSPLTSASGTSGDGVITLIAAVLIAGAALFTASRGLLGLLIVVAGGVGIYDLIHEHNKLQSVTLGGVQIDHVGWGLYVVVVGALIALGGLVKRMAEQ
jgi:hypothetical protein